MATVYDRVKTIVVEKLGVDEGNVTEEASFVDDLNADSLDLVELIMALEEEFSTDDERMEISDEEAGNLHTVRDAVVYLEGRGVQDD
ncbi:MAG: acyl carrier protein [Dehalococcoidia bacterium]|nr:acyl carrier protein [Dehalococcoidia bacterium]MSQ17086.1 acyl carrier protein [Dehalococcoidia bacterium]